MEVRESKPGREGDMNMKGREGWDEILKKGQVEKDTSTKEIKGSVRIKEKVKG